MEAPISFPSIEALVVLPLVEIPHVLSSSIVLQKVKKMALDPKPNLDHQENHVKVAQIQQTRYSFQKQLPAKDSTSNFVFHPYQIDLFP